MSIELDHLFIGTAPFAPEAEQFLQFGLREAPSNRHPGQDTRNRRFSFQNAMIELLSGERRRRSTGRTRKTHPALGAVVRSACRCLSIRYLSASRRSTASRPTLSGMGLSPALLARTARHARRGSRGADVGLPELHAATGSRTSLRRASQWDARDHEASADECRAALFDRSSENHQQRHSLEFGGRQTAPRN
jgi:Glyoxalase-like domain